MPSSAPYAGAFLRECVVEAVQSSSALMQALLDATHSALEESSADALRARQGVSPESALRELRTHGPALLKHYPEALLACITQALPQPAPVPTDEESTDFGALTLMDDAEITAQVERSRVLLLVMHATESALSELDSLMSAAQGLNRVQPQGNPLRPENYIRALQQTLSKADVAQEVRQLWMQHMQKSLGDLLAQSYRSAAARLRDKGVQPVGYVVVKTHSPEQGKAHVGQDTDNHALEEMFSDLSALRIEDIMPIVEEVVALAAMADADAASAGADVNGAGNVAEMERLVGRISVARTALAAQRGSAAGQRSAATATTVHPSSGELADTVIAPHAAAPDSVGVPLSALGEGPAAMQDVVVLMMQHIAQDPRLLPPVQNAVQRLAPALQKLVVHDPRFFTDNKHPARRLLDELTQRSLVFQREDAPEFQRFMRLLDEVVSHLCGLDIHGTQPFEQVLNALETVWSTRELEPVCNRAEEGGSQTKDTTLMQQLATQWRGLPDAAGAPEAWLNFVTGPWAQAAAMACAAQPQEADSQNTLESYRNIAQLLLRCVQPEILRSDPDGFDVALANAIPAVRQGLERISFPAQHIAQVLGRLEHLHQRVREHATLVALAGKTTMQTLPQSSAALPQLPSSGQTQTAPLEAAVAATDTGGIAASLRVGQWVEFANAQGIVRTQLTWCNPLKTLFLFSGENGSSHSMTRRMIDRMAAQNMFKCLPSDENHGEAGGKNGSKVP